MPRRRATSTATPVDLGSLTQAGARAVTCPECGDTRLTQIAMSLPDGTPVLFTSCRGCERRSWEHQDRQLEVTEVLERSRKPVTRV